MCMSSAKNWISNVSLFKKVHICQARALGKVQASWQNPSADLVAGWHFSRVDADGCGSLWQAVANGFNSHLGIITLGLSSKQGKSRGIFCSTMRLSSIALVLAVSSIVAALPSTDSSPELDAGLRLIKTSETDPGTWVTEQQKIVDYVAKNIYFIDITDIKVLAVEAIIPPDWLMITEWNDTCSAFDRPRRISNRGSGRHLSHDIDPSNRGQHFN